MAQRGKSKSIRTLIKTAQKSITGNKPLSGKPKQKPVQEKEKAKAKVKQSRRKRRMTKRILKALPPEEISKVTSKPKPKPKPKPKAKPRRKPKPKEAIPKIEIKYRGRFGRYVRSIAEAEMVEFYKNGRRYGRFPGIPARQLEADIMVTRDIKRGTEKEYYDLDYKGRFDWRPKLEYLRPLLVPRIGRWSRGKDIELIMVHVWDDQFGFDAYAEVKVVKSFRIKMVRTAVYNELVFNVLNNIRAVGGNTSEDALKRAGEIGSASKGYPLPDLYHVEVWTRKRGFYAEIQAAIKASTKAQIHRP